MKIEIDNKWIADYEEAVKIIKSEIAENLKEFIMTEENLERKTSYYYLMYKYNEVLLKLGGERGFIILNLKINGETVNLYKEDLRFDELKVASYNNFIITISLLKEYLQKHDLIDKISNTN